MTVHRFRLLLALYVGVCLAALITVLWPEVAGLGRDGALPWIFSQPLRLMALAAGVLVVAAAPTGLFFFKRWARPLALVTTLLCLPLMYFPEDAAPMLAALTSALLELTSLLWGGILALAYCSPVAERFRPGTGSHLQAEKKK